MMRVTVLKAKATEGAGRIVRYLDPDQRAVAVDDGSGVGRYYTGTDEPAGWWWGSGCAAVGLEGEVDPEHLARMLEAEHPITGTRLGRKFGDKSARAYDATFSAPKSVSLLWALAPDEDVRREIEGSVEMAAEATLGWFERHGCHTRRGTDGVFQVDAQGLTVAMFRHHTSRALDPQLHVHAAIWSKVQDPTGRWLALDARFLLKQQFTLSWIFDAALRAELDRRLGLAWDPLEPGHGQSDLAVVPRWVRDVYSQRTDQVEAKLDELIRRWIDEHDGADPDVDDLWELGRRAAVTSRPPKADAPPDLVTQWRETAADIGYQVPALSVRPTEAQVPNPDLWAALDQDAIVENALARVSEQGATWIGADLDREIAAQIPADVAYDAHDLVEVVDDLTADALAHCVELHPPAEPGVAIRHSDRRPVTEHVTNRAITTPKILRQEARLLDWADRTIEPAPTVEPDERTRAVAAAVAGTGELVLVVGPAGSGKTTAIGQGVTALSQQRRPVLGLAPSGKAADVLAEVTGGQAMTLAELLTRAHHEIALPPAGTTLILDEAGMACTDDLDQLTYLCGRRRWRLIAVGDPEQLPSVTRGGMFAHWANTLPAHRLDHIHRFTEAWQAETSLALRRGDPKAARAYVERGRVDTSHPSLVAHQVARRHQQVIRRGESLAITTSSAGMARQINEEIQWLHGRRVDDRRRVELADGSHARVGDQIATRRNLRLRADHGHKVRNRHIWTVTAIGDDGSITVANPILGSVTLPGSYVAEAVELGWAVTGYGNQGLTDDHAICVIEAGSSRSGIYVGLTRGRGINHAIIVDPTGTADPTEALAQAIARPPNALTAHARRDQLWRDHGLEPPARHAAGRPYDDLAHTIVTDPLPTPEELRRRDRAPVLSI